MSNLPKSGRSRAIFAGGSPGSRLEVPRRDPAGPRPNAGRGSAATGGTAGLAGAPQARLQGREVTERGDAAGDDIAA